MFQMTLENTCLQVYYFASQHNSVLIFYPPLRSIEYLRLPTAPATGTVGRFVYVNACWFARLNSSFPPFAHKAVRSMSDVISKNKALMGRSMKRCGTKGSLL